MAYLTRNGVSKVLSYSPYVFTEIIEGKQLDLHFSSRLHLKRFLEKRSENYTMIYNYIYKRFKVKTNCRLLADLNLYRKIENRGFYVKFNDKEFLCLDKIILNGESRMSKSFGEWLETLTTSYVD